MSFGYLCIVAFVVNCTDSSFVNIKYLLGPYCLLRLTTIGVADSCIISTIGLCVVGECLHFTVNTVMGMNVKDLVHFKLNIKPPWPNCSRVVEPMRKVLGEGRGFELALVKRYNLYFFMNKNPILFLLGTRHILYIFFHQKLGYFIPIFC